MVSYVIEENRLDVLNVILERIPEFENIPSTEFIQARISHVPHLILTAHSEDDVLGFKIGYERDGQFYSWLGAIIPSFRKMGIATAFANRQEEWARNHGYHTLWMKTRNRFPEMLIMALQRGFVITGFDAREHVREHRIILAKSL